MKDFLALVQGEQGVCTQGRELGSAGMVTSTKQRGAKVVAPGSGSGKYRRINPVELEIPV